MISSLLKEQLFQMLMVERLRGRIERTAPQIESLFSKVSPTKASNVYVQMSRIATPFGISKTYLPPLWFAGSSHVGSIPDLNMRRFELGGKLFTSMWFIYRQNSCTVPNSPKHFSLFA
jgi:hypothetical protein